jgi:hypothetical protein
LDSLGEQEAGGQEARKEMVAVSEKAGTGQGGQAA